MLSEGETLIFQIFRYVSSLGTLYVFRDNIEFLTLSRPVRERGPTEPRARMVPQVS